MELIYIHGFASAGGGDKYGALKRRFPNHKISSPTFPVAPDKAAEELKRLGSNSALRLIGTSLGGFYAMYVHALFGLPALIINPVTNPSELMTDVLGKNTNYKTGETFEWTREDLAELAKMEEEINAAKDWKNCRVLISEHDELIDHSVTKAYFDGLAALHTFDDDHRFSKFEEALEDERVISFFE